MHPALDVGVPKKKKKLVEDSTTNQEKVCGHGISIQNFKPMDVSIVAIQESIV